MAADKLMLESDKRERREDPLGPAATRLLEAGDKLGRVADEMMRQYQPSPTMAGRDF